MVQVILLFQLQSEIIMSPVYPDMLRPYPREPLPELFCNFDRLLEMLELWNLDGLILSSEKMSFT